MNRRELVRAVAAHTALDPKQVDATLAGVTEVVTAVVAKGDPVAIQGFAKFTKINRPARIARNPQTGEPVQVKAKTVAKATAMKAFRDTVMAPGTAPRLGRGVWPTDPELLTQQAQTRRAAVAAAAPARKAAAVKKTTKSAAKKSAAKKSAAKKATAKRAAKKATAKRATKKATAKRPAKKTTVKRSTAKKSTAKKSAAKRSTKRASARR